MESAWFKEVADVAIVSFETREAAAAAEKKAIEEEKPRFNVETRRQHVNSVSAARKRDERTRMRALGFVLRSAWIHPRDWSQYSAFVKRLNEARKKALHDDTKPEYILELDITNPADNQPEAEPEPAPHEFSIRKNKSGRWSLSQDGFLIGHFATEEACRRQIKIMSGEQE